MDNSGARESLFHWPVMLWMVVGAVSCFIAALCGGCTTQSGSELLSPTEVLAARLATWDAVELGQPTPSAASMAGFELNSSCYVWGSGSDGHGGYYGENVDVTRRTALVVVVSRETGRVIGKAAFIDDGRTRSLELDTYLEQLPALAVLQQECMSHYGRAGSSWAGAVTAWPRFTGKEEELFPSQDVEHWKRVSLILGGWPFWPGRSDLPTAQAWVDGQAVDWEELLVRASSATAEEVVKISQTRG